MTMEGASEPWHLDKRVPLALIVTLFLQTAGIVWWASTMQAGLQVEAENNDRQDVVLDAIRLDVQMKADRGSEVQRVLSEQIIEQRGDLRAIRELMQRIETRLDGPTRGRP